MKAALPPSMRSTSPSGTTRGRGRTDDTGVGIDVGMLRTSSLGVDRPLLGSLLRSPFLHLEFLCIAQDEDQADRRSDYECDQAIHNTLVTNSFCRAPPRLSSDIRVALRAVIRAWAGR